MQSKAETVAEYIETLPEDRKEAIRKLRAVFRKNLPKGFKEVMSYGMIGYVVPHSLYPAGYHCNPALPLPFINVGSQKNHISLHHMGLYADPEILAWFTGEFEKRSKTKLDMGKGCLRFKKPEHIPYELLGELASKISPADWIGIYERTFRR